MLVNYPGKLILDIPVLSGLLSYGRFMSRVAPNFGFGKYEIRPFFPNLTIFGSGQISGQIWPDLTDANATAMRSASYLITDKN